MYHRFREGEFTKKGHLSMNLYMYLNGRVKKVTLYLLVFLLVTASIVHVHASSAAGKEETYLPLVYRSSKQPVLLGTYSQGYIGSQSVMDAEYHALDAWAGERLSLAGVFTNIMADPVVNLKWPVEFAWANGYTPFVNLTVLYDSGITAKMIANGYADTNLHALARIFASLANNSNYMVYFAPLQEMNGNWVPYGLDPVNFKLAYRRIQQIFADEGVPSASARWVFAPNGWSAPGTPGFENYYPGDAYVDVVGFSSYNFGYCPVNDQPAWQTPVTVYHEYIDRMIAMAPSKPIFIAQTATSSYTKSGKSVAAKNQWLTDAYNYVAANPAVRAIIYYNRWISDCDWSFYQQGGEQYTGYRQGVANPVYGYVDPITMKNMIFAWP
jgi:hypothetical protein